MKIESYHGELREIRVRSFAFLVYEEDLSCLEKLDPEISGHIRSVVTSSGYRAKKGNILSLPMSREEISCIYLVGLGNKEKSDPDVFRYCAGELIRRAGKEKVKDIVICAPVNVDFILAKALAEGCELGSYSFEKYKTKKDDNGSEKIEHVYIYEGDEPGIHMGTVFASAQNFSRDLANEPGNVINPVSFSEEAVKLSETYGLSCEIWDEQKLKEERMLALWHVGKGSSIPPRFIHLSYCPVLKPEARIVFVGKGITFDSGGLNIKPGEHMRDMKGDKTGACNVLGVMKAIGELKPKVEVHVIVGAAENMPGGNSYRPDDIISARNGKTIEVDNTDAEGRVTLADALSFASELKPDMIIDMATLTGACVVALGQYTAGLFTNNVEAGKAVLEAAARSGERLWELPMDDEKLREQIKSSFADVMNTGGRWGGAITAAMFLEEFVDEAIPWVHLDIAGVDSYKKPFGYYPEGATAFGVRVCLELVNSLDKG